MDAKILYVEDEPFLAKVVKDTLEHQGFSLLLVQDGAEVIQAFDRYQPDLCVLDVMLPNMDGFSLGRILKARKPEVPIIYLTAKSFTEDVLSGFDAGASDYIRKPFSIEELIARIHNQLRNKEAYRSTASAGNTGMQLGNFLFYPDKLELVHDSGTTKLSYRETQVLTMLAQNVNQTTDRKALLLAVWGDDSFFNSRTLDVYVRKLRTYLEKDSSIEIITLKGKGYVFHTGNGNQ